MKPLLCIYLVLTWTLFAVPSVLAGDIVLHPEAASATTMQTRTYPGLNEPAFIPLCESFLKKDGWTISNTCPELGLVRAWTPTDVFSYAKKTGAVLLSLLSYGSSVDIDNEKRTFVVITVTPQAKGVTVRAQLTYKIYNEDWYLSEHGVDSQPESYTQFFNKLDTAIAATKRN